MWRIKRVLTQPEDGEEEEHGAGIQGTANFSYKFVIPCHLSGHLASFVSA